MDCLSLPDTLRQVTITISSTDADIIDDMGSGNKTGESPCRRPISITSHPVNEA